MDTDFSQEDYSILELDHLIDTITHRGPDSVPLDSVSQWYHDDV